MKILLLYALSFLVFACDVSNSLASESEADNVATLTICAANLSLGSSGVEVVRLSFLNDGEVKVVQMGYRVDGIHRGSAIIGDERILPRFAEMLRQAHELDIPTNDSSGRAETLITISGSFESTRKVDAASWILVSPPRSFIPTGLRGFSDLQRFFNKLPLQQGSLIRFLMNTEDSLHAGSYPFPNNRDFQVNPQDAKNDEQSDFLKPLGTKRKKATVQSREE